MKICGITDCRPLDMALTGIKHRKVKERDKQTNLLKELQ
jgi:hypothetical protein